MKLISSLILILSITIVSCQQNENETEQTLNDKSVIITNTWMRTGVQNRNSAAFMKITNNTDIDDTLYSVSSDLAKVVEIHETYERENDMKGMRHVDYLIIPSKSFVELKPGSFHIMLIGLNEDLKLDFQAKIKLFFKRTGEVEVPFTVRNP
jgi:copper(I)-binding protein